MKKRNLISCLIVMVLTALLFTGCGSGSGTSGKSEEASSAETPSPTDEPSPSEGSSAVGSAPAGGLTVDDAKKIAFDDARVTEGDVVLKKAQLWTDDGITVYEVEFYYENTEYSYDIAPDNGMILDVDRNLMDPEDYREMEALMKNSAVSTAGKAGEIDEEKALEIALKHANVSASDISRKKVNPDYDDYYGKQIYEVEFHVGQMEYSYDIDAETGDILDYESEIDD